MKIKAALLQYEVKPSDPASNFAVFKEMFLKAKEEGVQGVLAPEFFISGYAENIEKYAESTKGKQVAALSKLCAENNMYLLGGSFAEKKDGQIYNTSLAIDNKGAIISKYRKVHLFDGEVKESDKLFPGDEWCVYDLNGVGMGMLTCFDLRFPAFIQNLTLRGAKILCVSAQWPAKRFAHWRILLQARAIENEVWVIACNSCGLGAFECAGHSMIIAPDGTIIGEADDKQVLLTADIDTEQKGYFDILRFRLPILDEIDENQI